MAKIGAMARVRARRKARLEEKRKAVIATRPSPDPIPVPVVPVAPVVEPELIASLKQQVSEHKALAENAAKAPKLVRSGRAAELAAEADKKAEVLAKMEAVNEPPAATIIPAASAPMADIHVALSVFEQAMIVLSVGADVLKINKWYAVGGSVGIAVLYFIAEKQGWLDFINF